MGFALPKTTHLHKAYSETKCNQKLIAECNTLITQKAGIPKTKYFAIHINSATRGLVKRQKKDKITLKFYSQWWRVHKNQIRMKKPLVESGRLLSVL